MALLDGKQLRNTSTELDKLSGTGIVSFTAATMSFGSGAVLTTDDANIVNGIDVVNKNYVDSVAAGLDPKESVKVIATASISLSGTGATIDGYTLGAGDRILVNGQAGATANGIYGVTAGAWSRTEDADGTPSNEVSLGNFVFVEEGTVYGGSGWVLSVTDSPDSDITPDVETQVWTQFSAAGYYTAGTGLTLTGSEFSINNTGVSATTYGGADQAVSFTVNAQGQLTSASTQSISITSGQVSDFTSASETAIFTDANFVDGITVTFSVTTGDSVTAEVVDGSLGVVKLDTAGNGGATAGYILSNDGAGNFAWTAASAGDITEVLAGEGLVGGGAAGSVTLDVNTGLGVTISSDKVATDLLINGGLTYSGNQLTVDVDGSTIQIIGGQLVASPQGDITGITAGAGLTGGGDTGFVTLNVGAGTGITVNADDVAVDFVTVADTIQGQGLTSSGSGVINVDLSATSGLTFSGAGDSGQLQVSVDGTSIQINGSGQLVSVGGAQPYYGDRNLTPSTTAPNTDDENSGITITNTPNDYSRVQVYVNGQLQYLGDNTTTADCYFGTASTVPVAITDIQSGYTLFWNGQDAGFRLTTTDRVDIIYEV